MEKSLDSIGSCSLNTDLESSNVSDTSESLNFSPASPAKDITRIFTSNMRERCEVQQNIDSLNNLSTNNASRSFKSDDKLSPSTKKPSYLSLACCVNGYSNLTTYDSKVRQEINKSREVSPIRPSTTSIECYKKGSSLGVPLHIMSSTFASSPVSDDKEKKTGSPEKMIESQTRSFIQQRVERLYGPSALAQGFYSPKKIFPKHCNGKGLVEIEHYESQNRFSLKNMNKSIKCEGSESIFNDNNSVDLPVMRFLSQEFRAQLPKISPKKYHTKNLIKNEAHPSYEILTKNDKNDLTINSLAEDEVDRKVEIGFDSSTTLKRFSTPKNYETGLEKHLEVKDNSVEKDGNYFLLILKYEQNRLLCLAHEAEKYIDVLSTNHEVNEEVLGFLRLASGKARLLVSQKMKQFEGLCHNNLNRSLEQKFPTTKEDLEGFWDMVYLQVEHIDSIFQEVEAYRANNWKKPDIEKPAVVLSKITKPTKHGIIESKVVSSKSPAISIKALRREAQRKEFIELKRKQKKAMVTKDEAVLNNGDVTDIFASKNS